MFARSRSFAISLLLLSFGCRTTVEPKPLERASAEPPGKLAAPQYLSNDARLMLSDRMQRHGRDLTNLMWSMLFLENDAVARDAEMVAATGWIANPSDRALLESLPASFFDLQRDLAERARIVAQMARQSSLDHWAMTRAFASLSETCVRCHSIYLYGDSGNVARE